MLTVSGEIFAKLGGAGYVYRDMWAGPPQENGTCDVEDSVTGLIRTEGPTISFNGAWAQNIDEEELFIDFMGNQGGIRLQYGQDFTFYTTRYGALVKEKPEFKPNNMYEAEIDAFVRCIRTGKNSPTTLMCFCGRKSCWRISIAALRCTARSRRKRRKRRETGIY